MFCLLKQKLGKQGSSPHILPTGIKTHFSPWVLNPTEGESGAFYNLENLKNVVGGDEINEQYYIFSLQVAVQQREKVVHFL